MPAKSKTAVAPKNYFAVKPAAEKGTTKKATVYTEVEGLEHYTAFDTVCKGAGALKEAEGVVMKSGLTDAFIEEGCRLKAWPNNFHGKEGNAVASVQLRRKTVKSPLDGLQVKALKAAKIPVKKINATFQIAEKYMDDMALLEKLNKALANADMPEDLFEQNSEERHVVTDETVTAIFKTGDAKLANKLIPMVAGITVVPTWHGTFFEALKSTINELKVYEIEGKTVEGKVEKPVAGPKVQHLNVAKAKEKPAAITVAKSSAKPVAAAKAKPKVLATSVDDIPDYINFVKGSASQTFTKGQFVWANYGDGYAYPAKVLAAGSITAKVKFIADDVIRDTVQFTDMLPIYEEEAA